MVETKSSPPVEGSLEVEVQLQHPLLEHGLEAGSLVHVPLLVHDLEGHVFVEMK